MIDRHVIQCARNMESVREAGVCATQAGRENTAPSVSVIFPPGIQTSAQYCFSRPLPK